MEIDANRLAAEIAADADVVRSLKANGDVSSIIRNVGARFEGSETAIANLQRHVEKTEWRVVQVVKTEDGQIAIDIERDQTTDLQAVRELTVAALKIEMATGAVYDGWGTIAMTNPENSN